MKRRRHWRRLRKILATRPSKTDNIPKHCCRILKLSMQVSIVLLSLPPSFPSYHGFVHTPIGSHPYQSTRSSARSNESLVFHKSRVGSSKNEQMGGSIVRFQVCRGTRCRYAQSLHHRHQMSDQAAACS